MTPFFVQKDVFGEKIINWVKYGNVFTQIMMVSHKKLTTWEREEKGTTNSAPMITKLKEIIVAQASHSGMASSVAKKSE